MAITQDQQFTNNATTTVPGSLTNVATSITVSTGTGSLFPTLSGAQFFVATIVNSISSDPGFGQLEIVKVTARSGDVLTVVRGQESTSAKAFPAGCVFELRPTAGGINEVYNKMIAGDALQAPLASPTFTGDPKAPTPALGDNDTSIATSGYVQTAFNTYGDRHVNMIINPHGSIQQETTSFVSTAGAYYADQWSMPAAGASFGVQAGVVSGATSAVDPSVMFIATTSAKGVLAAGDFVTIEQPIEGLVLRRLLYGTSLARGSWLRWRANATQSGTASISIRNAAANRSFVQSFAVTTTPTDYAVFVPADTTGTWVTSNAVAARVDFCHAAGTTYQTSTLGAWQAGNFLAANTQSNMLDTVNRQLNITDVQWNDAPILMPFVTIDYQQELTRCKRYWESSYNAGVSPGSLSPNGAVHQYALGTSNTAGGIIVAYEVEKRITLPTVNVYSPTTGTVGFIRDNTSSTDRAATIADTGSKRAFAFTNPLAGGAVDLTAHWVANARM